MLTKQQREYVRSNFINLSKLTRAGIEKLKENREGQNYKVKPSQIPNEVSNDT